MTIRITLFEMGTFVCFGVVSPIGPHHFYNSRTTSRVLAPSGGQSSLTFGLRPTPPVKPEVKPVIKEEEEKVVVVAAVANGK